MNKDDLHDLPAKPRPMRPGYANELYGRLNEVEPAKRADLLTMHWRLALTGMAAMAIVASLVLSPMARATAESFLNLFRVKRITAIAIDPARIQQLREQGITNADIEALIGDAMVEDAEQAKLHAEPRLVADVNEASPLAGFTARLPDAAAFGLMPPQIYVQDAQTVRFRGNLARLNSFMQLLSITDVTLPAQLDGAVVTVTKPAAVMVKYGNELTLIQSRSPEMELPDDVNLAQLGEIGLRVAGLSPDEARRIAQSTDWNSTLVMPIPTDAASFREVTLNNGASALLVTTGGTGAMSMRGPQGQRQRTTLVWTEGDMVYALSGGFTGDVVNVANSMR